MSTKRWQPKSNRFEELLEDIRQRRLFSYSRWGDGEIGFLVGRLSRTCDGQLPAELREPLAQCLSNPSVRLGLAEIGSRRFGKELSAWLNERNLSINWDDGDAFHFELHRCSNAGEPFRLAQCLRDRNGPASVLLVGPKHLVEGLRDVLRPDAYVVVHRHQAGREVDRILNEVSLQLATLPSPVFIWVSAGLTANIVVDRLAFSHSGDGWFIDLRSLWDSMRCGRPSLRTPTARSFRVR